ncbi:MAG: O-antigen ligase family protein [Candidatus Marinimicrobia bacterium]|nr:O-antigen ligase family protein [Candidatus Neomarinimicrobiota bacterium]
MLKTSEKSIAGQFVRFAPPFLVQTVPLYFSTAILDSNSLQWFAFSVSLLMFGILLLTQSGNWSRIHLPKTLVTISCLYILLIFISTIIKGSPLLLLSSVSIPIQLFFLSFFVMIYINIYNSEVFIRYTAWSILVVSGIISTVGILQAYNIYIINLPELSPPGSTLMSRNFAGQYIVGALPWGFILWSKLQSKKIRFLIAGIILLQLSYAMILRARSVYVTLFCIILVTMAISIYRHEDFNGMKFLQRHSVLIIVIIISLGLGFLSPKNVHFSRRSFLKTIEKTYKISSSDDRVQFAFASIQMFLDNPVLGIGGGRWSGVYPRYNGSEYTDDTIYFTKAVNPHNDYLEILTEHGSLSFLIYLSLIVFAARSLLSISRENGDYLFLFLSFLALVLISNFTFVKERAAPMLIMFSIIGIAFAQQQPSWTFSKKAANRLMIMLVLISISGAFFNFNRLQSEKYYVRSLQLKFEKKYAEMNESLNNIKPAVYPLDPNGMPPAYYHGVGYYVQSKFQEALTQFRIAEQIAPWNPLILNNIASTDYRLGHENKAIKLYQLMKKTFPNYLEPQLNLIVLFHQGGKTKKAKNLIRELAPHVNNNKRFQELREVYNVF